MPNSTPTFIDETFQQWEAPSDIQHIAIKIWYIKHLNTQPQIIPVIPYGSHEIIFNIEQSTEVYYEPSRTFQANRGMIAGQIEKAIYLKTSQLTHSIGVQLTPYGLHLLAGLNVSVIHHNGVYLDDLFGLAGAQLNQQILEMPSPYQKAQLLIEFIRKQAAKSKKGPHIIQPIVRDLVQNYQQLTLPDIQRKYQISERTLERMFVEKIGISPKFFLRLMRLQKSLTWLKQHPNATMMDLVTINGYYDQPHFNKEVKALTGMTPKQLFEAKMISNILYARNMV